MATFSTMNQATQSEIAKLRAEIEALHDRLDAKDLEGRLADRDRDCEKRLAILDKATELASGAEGIEPRLLKLLDYVKAVVLRVHTQGYAIVPNLLDASQVERVRKDMEPLFESARGMFGATDQRGDRVTFHIQNVFAKSVAADEVAVHPLLRAIIRGILGNDFILNAGAIAMSPDPGCSAQHLHRDDGCYPLPLRPRPPLVVTAAMALDDFTADNGATLIVPGSCCWPASRRPEANEVSTCEMSAGSLLLWDGAVFHGGGGNVTRNQTRRTLAFNYSRGWLRTQYNQYLSIPRARVLSMSPELQSDLGYKVSARGLGGCDNRDPLDYLQEIVSRGGDGVQPMLGPENQTVTAPGSGACQREGIAGSAPATTISTRPYGA